MKGGIYYFSDDKLQDKEAYNIEPIDQSRFLAQANEIEEKAKTVLMSRR